MIYGSVCSGVEAATVAWHPLGWEPAFFSEIDKFPINVLKHHYPSVPLHGDFTTIGAKQYGPIDLLVGGTPCQDFSIAGLRKGLDGDRGNLTLEFIRLAERLKPRWILWENVPGVLSIDGGKAFGAFLGGLAELGYGFSYRVLDAQYFGVPQRRRRVFVVGYLGDWRPPAAVFFERESLRGDITPRREAGEGVAGAIAKCSFSGGAGGRPEGAAAGHFIGCGIDYEHNAHSLDEPTGPLLKGSPSGGGHALPAVVMATGQSGAEIALDLAPSLTCNHEAPIMTGPQARGGFFNEETTHTLRGEGFDASEDGTGLGIPIVPISFDCKASGQNGFGVGEISSTMRSMGNSKSHANGGGHLAVAFAQNQAGELRVSDIAGTINTNSNASGSATPMTQVGMTVRRLTPVECERLQGFPDNYTLIPNARGGGAGRRWAALQSDGKQHGRSGYALARRAY